MKLFYLLTCAFSITFSQVSPGTKAPIRWLDNIPGDFSFSKHKSLLCEAWCYEWGGTDEIIVKQKTKDTVVCETTMNEATHCSLHLVITGDSCSPTINLLSITPGGNRTYYYKAGFITIDKKLWDKKIMKAAFSFDFINEEGERRIFWKGKIYAKVK